MSKIDEAITAIQAAVTQVNEVQVAIGAADTQADEAYQNASALGAEGVAQAMNQCKEALSKANSACGTVSGALDEAVAAAQSATG